jgi:3-phosphoshikimate 1-carboxyvinyltransferase
MNITVYPAPLQGQIEAVSSKSIAHRALICAALADLHTDIRCDLPSRDIQATRACVTAILDGGNIMECGESGSTLRFLLPVMGALGRKGIFMTHGRLSDRPMLPLVQELENHGCILSPPGETPITIEGQLEPGIFTLPGNISSQYITGLLLALPLLNGNSTIEVMGKLESAPYVAITTEVLRQFGITWIAKMTRHGMSFEIPGNQIYEGPDTFVVEGDWSAAAFWLAAGALGNKAVTVKGLNMNSMQGDIKILDVLRQFCVEVIEGDGEVTAHPSHLQGCVVDVSAIPDLAPVIALLGAAATGKTEIVNAARLRLKESDRLHSIAEGLNALGMSVREKGDSLIIKGSIRKGFRGGKVSSFGDHRIVMMEAIASVMCKDKVIIDGKEDVAKSYPGFFQVMRQAGLDQNVE